MILTVIRWSNKAKDFLVQLVVRIIVGNLPNLRIEVMDFMQKPGTTSQSRLKPEVEGLHHPMTTLTPKTLLYLDLRLASFGKTAFAAA